MPPIITPERRAAKAAYQRAYRVRNPEKAAASVEKCFAQSRDKYNSNRRAKYEVDEQRRQVALERVTVWQKNNLARKRQNSRAYVDRNRPIHNEKGRKWKKNNRDKCKTHKHTRRALIKNCEGNHTTAEWRAILKRHGHRCSWCGAPETKIGKLTRDHYIPLSKGGTNNASNIVPACLPCNSKKNRRDPIEFAKSLGLLL